ncbi:hypothetical protein GLAREA_07715 [Glarea lozoyensis ATCC 20868]|uniref:DUF1754-domain-containing protein n=1 Tax=Glarea lozoyensis (strain ATCC 20868 / MF5171) TaxID=1116229 RepID=S3DKK1_GLAL2|nr:uncharacterized protein GLAREA_07715 [Glarea lozoyensis ATCC 20868]EPE32581.1 hypothetical protein GLAREA_07715 [Glarea lozoyensis ATCC 20868]
MPSDDYTPIVRGGLKLKGASAPSGIKKKKKKSKPTVNEEGLSKAIDSDAGSSKKAAAQEEEGLDLRELEPKDFDGKTATERAYEETRRKRLERRLEKEGPKTHKQRVEGLNTYLSTLSEHHDMPRIGPG